MIHLKRPAKGSKHYPNLPLTLQTPLDLLDHLTKRQSNLYGNLDLLLSLLLFWTPLKTSCFLGHLVNEPEWHTLVINQLTPKSKEFY